MGEGDGEGRDFVALAYRLGSLTTVMSLPGLCSDTALGPSEEYDFWPFQRKKEETDQRGHVAFPRLHSQMEGTGTGALSCCGHCCPHQALRRSPINSFMLRVAPLLMEPSLC